MLNKTLSSGIVKIQSFMSRPWYVPLVALLAALDFFVFVFPIDFLLITRLLVRHDRWVRTVLLMAVASGLGALLLCCFVQSDLEFISRVIERHHHHASPEWIRASDFIRAHGVVGVGIAAVTFFPLPVAVAVAAWEKVSLGSIVLVVFLGRGLRYFVYASLAVYFPKVAHRLIEKFHPKSS